MRGWRRERTWVLVIAGLALLARAAYLGEAGRLPEFRVPILDAHIHDTLGRAIANGNVLGDEVFFRAPLYLYLVGLFYFLFGPSPWSVRIFQCLLGAATAVLAWRVGRRCFSEWVGRIAGLALALTWTLVYFDGELLIASVNTFLDLLLLDRLLAASDRPSRGRWLVAGVVLGLSAVTRPTILVFGWLAVLWIVWTLKGRETRSRTWRAVAAYGIGSLLVIAPVTVRNAVVGHDFVLIASQGGINLYLGNNPGASGWSATSPEIGRDWWGGFDDAVRIAEKAEGRALKPSEVSRYWTRRSVAFWFDDPGRALALGLRKLFFFWGAVEIGNDRDMEFFREQSRVLRALPFSFAWFAPLGILGLALAGRRKDRWLLVSFVLLYMAVVVLFFVCARFRMPVVPVLAVLASAGAVWLVERVRARSLARAGIVLAGLAALALFLHFDLFHVRDPNHTQSLFNRGLVAARLGDDRAAERAYLETLERDPAYVDALNNLGGVYVRQGRLDEARALFERVLAVEPGNATAAYNLGVLLEKGADAGGAEARYRAALEADPYHLPAKVGLARALRQKGDPAAARRLYEEALAAYRSRGGLGPGDIRVRFEEDARSQVHEILVALGSISSEMGFLAPALRYYREALEMAPDDPEAHYRVGYVLLQMRDYDAAIPEFEAELARDPKHTGARYALALCYASKGSTLPAIRELRAVLEQDPSHDRAWQALGVLYAQNESYDEAIEAFEEALKINPQSRYAQQGLDKARQYRSR